MSWHVVVIDKVLRTQRETRGPYATFDAAVEEKKKLRALYEGVPASRGSLAKDAAAEHHFEVVSNLDQAPAQQSAA